MLQRRWQNPFWRNPVVTVQTLSNNKLVFDWIYSFDRIYSLGAAPEPLWETTVMSCLCTFGWTNNKQLTEKRNYKVGWTFFILTLLPALPGGPITPWGPLVPWKSIWSLWENVFIHLSWVNYMFNNNMHSAALWKAKLISTCEINLKC